MKIKGKYAYYNLTTEHTNCICIFKNGEIKRINKQNTTPNDLIITKPRNKNDFEFDKTKYEDNLYPTKHNYYIKYFDKRNEEKIIYLKLTIINILRVKWNLKQYLIQSDELKINIIKYIIGGIIGILITLSFQLVSQRTSNQTEATPNIKGDASTNLYKTK